MIRINLLAIVFSSFALFSFSARGETEPSGPSAAQMLDKAVGTYIVAPMAGVLFYDIAFWDNHQRPEDFVGATLKDGTVIQYELVDDTHRFYVKLTEGNHKDFEHRVVAPSEWDALDQSNLEIPFIVAWLICGAVFFTLRMRFINLTGVKHAVDIIRGEYDDDEHDGDISHFQALSSALSATVGLGNIAGVAVAVSAGGPGAIFWMIFAGFLGMTSKFVECTLGQMYRVKTERGISGGPMHYLKDGLAGTAWAPVGKVLAMLFAAEICFRRTRLLVRFKVYLPIR